jgi:hypothetical protein
MRLISPGAMFRCLFGNRSAAAKFYFHEGILQEDEMGLGRGALLWLIGIPLPIILLLALFWR